MVKKHKNDGFRLASKTFGSRARSLADMGMSAMVLLTRCCQSQLLFVSAIIVARC